MKPHEAYAKDRGISLATLEACAVKGGTAPFQGGKAPAIFFPYHDVEMGDPINWKARSLEGKRFTSKPEGKWVLWNLPGVVTAETVYLTEGEIDALSLVEAGVDPGEVASLPGASMAESVLLDALDKGLCNARRFVLCMDGDDAGLQARQVVVKVLGPARCWFVDWPPGIKDANDMLRTVGPDGLLAHLDTAKPWPVSGLYTLDDLPEPPPLVPWRVFPEWEDKLCLAAGTMGVVTGHPGHGKSHLVAQAMYQVCEQNELRAAVASMETMPKPHLRRHLRSFRYKALEKNLTGDQIAEADNWIRDHLMFMQHPEARPEVGWLLETAEVAVVRHGARFVLIDPWNKLESNARGDVDTAYIGRSLDTIYDFAKDLNVCVVIVAHPAKMGGRIGEAPLLEDIAGSKHWDNRVDWGAVVHADDGLFDKATNNRNYERTVYVRKTRYDALGRPCRLGMRLNDRTGCYVSTDYETVRGMAGAA